MSHHPTHLDPSELGTKEYWDRYYQNDLDQNSHDVEGDDDDEDEENNDAGLPADPSDLDSWFDDVNAPAKVLEYLTSEDFPLSPTNLSDTQQNHKPTILDLGTGNGGMLFTLRIEGGYEGRMVGVDYSQQSIDLATKLRNHFRASGAHPDKNADEITFERMDLIRDDPEAVPWWPRNGFDLVLDKGTFDAISLSSETSLDSEGHKRRLCEVYPSRVIDMVTSGGYLLITSCNWTEDEVIQWFLQSDGVEGRLKVFGKIKYPVYAFGGQEGQGAASVCFQKL